METVKLSSKGQVVIPKSIRDAFHLHAGEEFVVTAVGGEIRLRLAGGSAKPTTLGEVAGMLYRPGAPRMADDETDKAIGTLIAADDDATKTKRKRA